MLPAIPPARLRRLRAEAAAILRRSAAMPPALRALCVFERDLPDAKRGGLAARGDAIFILGEACRFAPILAREAASRELVAAVRCVLGTPRIALHFSNLTTKAARFGAGIAWHRDAENRYMPTRAARFVRAMVCLDGMRAWNGGTAFRPARWRAPVTPVCRPGAVVLIGPQVLHGGAPNHSPTARRNLIVQWGRHDDPPLTAAREAHTGLSPRQVVAGAGLRRR